MEKFSGGTGWSWITGKPEVDLEGCFRTGAIARALLFKRLHVPQRGMLRLLTPTDSTNYLVTME